MTASTSSWKRSAALPCAALLMLPWLLRGRRTIGQQGDDQGRDARVCEQAPLPRSTLALREHHEPVSIVHQLLQLLHGGLGVEPAPVLVVFWCRASALRQDQRAVLQASGRRRADAGERTQASGRRAASSICCRSTQWSRRDRRWAGANAPQRPRHAAGPAQTQAAPS
jgi:hypothetical protein